MGAPKLTRDYHISEPTESESRHLNLVQDINSFWSSTLFSDVYLRNDVPSKYRDVWENNDAKGFYEFCEQFRQLICEDLQGEEFESWSERTTINRFIKPILRLLGWTNKCSPNLEPWIEDETLTVTEGGELKIFKPDFIIVDNPKQLKYIENKDGEAKTGEARRSSIISIEAKYWGRIDESKYSNKEDKSRADKKSQNDATKTFDFDEQCLKYIEILQHDFGILTDGRTWRLYHRELSSGTFKRYYQFNLGILAKHVKAGLDKNKNDYNIFIENAKYFYHFFSKAALFREEGNRRFVDELITDSRKYSDSIEEDLRIRFVSAMATACNGFKRSLGKNYSQEKLEIIRSSAESYIFNILFIRFCESRNILPLRQNPIYRSDSLSNIIDKLDFYDPEKEVDDLNTPTLINRFKERFNYKPNATDLYDSILKLVDILQNGLKHPAAKFSIDGFKETAFDDDEYSFVQKHKLSNAEMVRLLFELAYIEGEKPGQYQQIAYSFFAPRQLGSIYESFLEFRLDQAKEDMAFIKKQWSPADLKSDKINRHKVPKVVKDELFFTPDNAERKVTGSYYTPDEIVSYIVATTLESQLAELSADEVLELKICDPAMGSGHFLSGALNFLAGKYLALLADQTNGDLKMDKVDAKHEILRKCIFGVDINPRAVKLAKLSLWMETAANNRPLDNLKEQLICGDAVNSQSMDWKFSFSGVFKHSKGFHAVLMNPPYLGIKDNSHRIGYLRDLKEWAGIVTNKYDLFYFFIARGIEILRPQGALGCITTAYWPTADGANKLRGYLSEHATPTKFVSLENIKVFSAAQGQHNLISFFKKSMLATGEIKMLRISSQTKEQKLSTLRFDPSESVPGSMFRVDEFKSSLSVEIIRSIKDAPWNLSVESGSKGNDIINKMLTNKSRIADYFSVHSGIETGADRVTPKHIDPKGVNLDCPVAKYKLEITKNKIKKGDGIFVISDVELELMGLSSKDRERYIKPFLKNGDIKTPYLLRKKNFSHFLIYFENGDLKSTSQIYKHLERFKPILENRYKYRTEERLQWFDLHRPLSADIISSNKLVSPYRAMRPIFVYSKDPVYSSIDVFFTIPLNPDANLFLILGLLNSKVVWYWLKHRGKVKGKMLELYSKPIGDIPYKNYSFDSKHYGNSSLSDAIRFLDSKSTEQERCAFLISSLSYQICLGKLEISHAAETIDLLALAYYGIKPSASRFIEAELAVEEEVSAESTEEDTAA